MQHAYLTSYKSLLNIISDYLKQYGSYSLAVVWIFLIIFGRGIDKD